MKPHGLDYGRYTEWRRPANPPKPIDFLIVGVSSGNYLLPTYHANAPEIEKEQRLICYHFYEPVQPQQQADVFIPAAKAVGAKAAVIDWENTRYHTLNDNDVTALIELHGLFSAEFEEVMVYMNQDTFWFLQQKAPEFAEKVELWLAYYYPDPETVDNYALAYQSKIKRPFSSVRFIQYTDKGDAQAYGAVNDKKEMDLNVFQGTMQELDEWLGITSEPEPPTPPTTNGLSWIIKLLGGATQEELEVLREETREILAQQDARIADIEELVDVTQPTIPDYTLKTVDRDGKNVYLSYYKQTNNNGAPIFIFYPSDGAPVNERVFVPSGTQLRVTDKVVGDGGNVAWKVIAPIPANNVPDVQLYIMEKFIKG